MKNQNQNMILWNEKCCEREALQATINESRLTSGEEEKASEKAFWENWEFERRIDWKEKDNKSSGERERRKKKTFST